ncbi:hypothetical protein OIU84_020817 [Salix udensis]|uniref:Uncharacterized protein n=1 Tax=Salix udensis TaxID=889485 RepID=A0AAD6KT57_9ROSI|nr:hypothetical protein OIU84_020817 [Salix udensis]
MTIVILQRSIQISPQEAHLGQLQVVDLAALSGVTGGAWRLEERRGRRLAGQGSDTDKVKNGVAERSGRSRWISYMNNAGIEEGGELQMKSITTPVT